MYELRLPLAPYRFVWRDEAAVDAEKDATDAYTEERYTHADGTRTIIREYRADASPGLSWPTWARDRPAGSARCACGPGPGPAPGRPPR